MVAVHLRSRVMRVLIVLSTDARRGAEIEGQSLAAELSAAGVTTTVVALAAEAVGAVRLDVPVLGRTRLGVATLRALRARARDHDVVVAYGSSTLQACALALLGARTPFVYRSIGDPAEWVRGRRHAARTAWFMKRAARVVALWDGAAQSIVEVYGLPAERVVVIPNARSHQEFLPPTPDERRAARQRFGVVGAESLVVVVGALSDEKRVDLAVHAVARVPDGKLLVVGDGPRRSSLESLGRAELGARVEFTGALHDVLPVYHAADVVLMTSRTEGMPGVLLEAGLVGAPVVATDVGAVSWLVEHGVRGEVVPVDTDADGLAAAVLRVRTQVAPPSGESSAARLAGCRWDDVRPRWLDCLGPLGQARSGGRPP